MAKPNLVLDWDSTLAVSINANQLPQNDNTYSKTEDAILSIDRNGVYGKILLFLRPGLHRFLQEAKKNYDLTLWSFGVLPYIEECMHVNYISRYFQKIIPRQANIAGITPKDLSLLNVPMNKVVIVDDSNNIFGILNPFNCLDIDAWEGNKDDQYLDVLLDLIAYKFKLLQSKDPQELLALRNEIFQNLTSKMEHGKR